jgi:S1-C subfamily serine protease
MHLMRNTLIGLVLTAGFLGGLVVSGRMSLTQPSTSTPIATQAPAPQARPLPATATLPDLSPIAERALKVAANISSTAVVMPSDPFERMWFGAQPSGSAGSGVVVSPDGYIVTNSHVIQSARAEVRVTLPDGKERPAKLVGIDSVSDLAVVKVDATNLETLPWGDSSKLRIAEWVLAIGNPFQLSGTVTLGIVSTVNRSGAQMGSVSDFIQTDAAINPGNSGGALVNARGELVGINSMIYSESGGNQGIGFAIPSNTVRDVMKQLIDYGQVRWGSIGNVRVQAVDRATARYNGLGDSAGLVVMALAVDSSAARAGLRRYDLIIRANGQAVSDGEELSRTVLRAKQGDTLKLDVLRQGRQTTLSVPVVSR